MVKGLHLICFLDTRALGFSIILRDRLYDLLMDAN